VGWNVKDKVFKPVDFSDRGKTYLSHYDTIIGKSNRFTTNTPCPKCGECTRVIVKARKDRSSHDENTSRCTVCEREAQRKRFHKTAAYKKSALTIEQRRAIEDHQHRNDEDYFL